MPSAGARFATALEMKRALELAMSSSGLPVGANEIAQALASVAPDGRHEHEGWLDLDAESEITATPSLAAAKQLTRRLVAPPKAEPPPAVAGSRFGAGAVLGAGVVAVGFLLFRESAPVAAPVSPTGTQSQAEPRAAAASGGGTLHVNSKPTWATVRIDGRTAGSTPLVVSDIAPGPHSIEVSAEGQGPTRQRQIVVRSGATERVEFTLD
jgi:hypothetical protein